MKKIYRSIAVTVLAALMALPMVVRAEDKIVNTIYVTKPDASALHRLYVGQSKEDVLNEINKEIQDGKLKFQGGFPNSIEKVDLKVTGVRLKVNNGADEFQEVWPFKKVGKGYIYDKNDRATQITGLELIFNFVESDKGYKFAKTANMSIKDSENGAFLRKVGPSGSGSDGSTYFTFNDIHIFRQFKFVGDDNVKVRKVGAVDFNEQCDTELQLEENRTVGSCLKKEGDQNAASAAVEVNLQNGATKYAVFLNDFSGNRKFLPNETNIMTLGLDETRKADALKTSFMVRADKDEKIPYIEAQDVTLKPDEKVTAEELIRRAIKKLTRNVLNSQKDLDENELSKVKAFVEDANSEHPFGAADIEAAKALRANGLKIEYRYQPDLGNHETISANAKLFVEPAAAPNPPAPVPQPEQKQQAKTGNAYFDLGRNFLPTCPDSKCAKAGTNAKKDDVPNTAAAANN